jgi:hypothetical protein
MKLDVCDEICVINQLALRRHTPLRIRSLLIPHLRFLSFWTSNSTLIGRVALFLAIAPAGCMTISAQSTKPPRNDTEIWTETQVAIPLDKEMSLVLLGILRFGRNVSRPVNERIGAGVSFKAGKYLTLFPFYLRVGSQPTSTSHSSEDRITLEATLKFPAGHFTIADRNRVEFHIHHPAPNFTQYRNRLQLEHPLKVGEVEVDGFVADEIFYDSIANAWIRNRFYVGAIKKINKHFTLELYYVRQNDSHSHPGDINALGTTFKFRL